MAGDVSEVTRNDAWITVLATSEQEAQRRTEEAAAVRQAQSEMDAPTSALGLFDADGVLRRVPDTDHDSAEAGDEGNDGTAPSGQKRRIPLLWSALSIVTFVAGVASAVFAAVIAADRYFPQFTAFRGVDGDPPAVFVQSDEPANVAAEWAGLIAERSTSWPYVLAVPMLAAALLGLLTGWLRWRMGLARTAERRARASEAAVNELTARIVRQDLRLQAIDTDLQAAQEQVVDLSEALEGQSDRASSDALVGERLVDDLEAKSLEAKRLTADLEDALIARDVLETELHAVREQLSDSAEERERAAGAGKKLKAAAELIREQRRKIDSLEHHLDQVRRRTSEMANEARSAQQLRNAWDQAESVIADLSQQLADAQKGQASFSAQTAEAILADNSRVAELEALLNEAADVIESIQEQLRQTRFQLSERDAAIARADVRNEALRTEITLLTEEIDQAAYTIARLQELPDQNRRNQAMMGDLREALDAERARSADLERQLRTVSARAFRLEQRLLEGAGGADGVLDLTDPVAAPAA